MTKAYLMNSARYLTGTDANDTLPSSSQGMGEVNLGTAFDGASRILRDQIATDKFTASGQSRSFTGTITDNSKPFRVTLAWTDAPGNTTGNSYNNNLDLTVTVGGQTYKGNVFNGAYSVTDGTADAKNNVESVFLPAGVTGPFTVTVTAANINSDGVPNQSPTTDQDFALAIYNGVQAAVPLIAIDGYSLTAESCIATNGVIDPGETVTVDFTLKNFGIANVTNLIATLLATNGIIASGESQIYGLLDTNGVPITRSFTFTAQGVCGGTITATLLLQEGTNDLGTATLALPLGEMGILSSENFDGVTAPALPPAWTTTTVSGGQSPWVTAAENDTAPNTAFSNEAGTAGINELVSPAILLPANPAQLSFRNNYSLEANTGNTSVGYDGGVLEIKIGAGPFTDIITAGGSFMTGGYNRTISDAYNSPLANRLAWSGNSGGFITTTISLPAAAAGQTVQFRWRCGTDSSVGGAGWKIDSIEISASICCGDMVAPVINTQPLSQTVPSGNPVNFFVNAIGTAPLDYQWYFNSNPISVPLQPTTPLSAFKPAM